MNTIVKRKIKKEVIIYLFAGIVTITVISILAINYVNDYRYRQTQEYKLLEHGYSKEDTNEFLHILNEEEIEELLIKEKNDSILKFIKEKYYIKKNLDTYLEFEKENPEFSSYDIIAMVNVHANQEWYEKTEKSNTELGNVLLVNKYYQLNENYTPENLTTVSNWYCYGTQQMVKEAYDAFINMYNKALESNIKLIINSSYRSYQDQEETYNQLKRTYGTERAEKQAARPGHSEHETGLSFDVFTKNNTTTEDFKNSDAYLWLKENAHKYGFIERYPEGKENITGYAFESWHWRYVGIEVATKIYEEQITFDEYYAYYIENQQ